MRDVPVDPYDFDRLLEEYRLAAQAWVEADDLARRLADGKSLLLDRMTEELLGLNPGMAISKAERQAKISEQYSAYLNRMHDARLEANNRAIDKEVADHKLWQLRSVQANWRAERRATG